MSCFFPRLFCYFIVMINDTFNFQSDISIGQYKLNFNSREISKNHKIIDLTEREINLIFFLKEKARAVKIEELQREVWSYNPKLETHTVETHIYRLRKKIKDEFGDDNFILSSRNCYYINLKKKIKLQKPFYKKL